MIENTVDQVQAWIVAYPSIMKNITASINLSASQLDNKDFPDQLTSLISRKGLSPKHFILEVTETALIKQPEVTSRILNQLRDTGFQISIDDFGTGYSSLTFLKDFPIDELKINYKFVSGIVTLHDLKAFQQ